MGVRRQARELAVQALYMCDMIGSWDRAGIDFLCENLELPDAVKEYGLVIVFGVADNLATVDSRITRASENWSLSRMSRVDKAILRMGSYELIFREDIPVNVAINEAIEVAKRFGSNESSVFVNGVLDRVAQSRKAAAQVSVSQAISEATPEQLVEVDAETEVVPRAVVGS